MSLRKSVLNNNAFIRTVYSQVYTTIICDIYVAVERNPAVQAITRPSAISWGRNVP